MPLNANGYVTNRFFGGRLPKGSNKGATAGRAGLGAITVRGNSLEGARPARRSGPTFAGTEAPPPARRSADQDPLGAAVGAGRSRKRAE